ncbi:hypothetical protein IM538_13935 [Cytobacillus suaedae]|nr:hypothetical protein IM538_13935 [Cytobacillus suaedae]
MNILSAERILRLISLTLIFLIGTGCTMSKDENINTLTALIENEFTGPSDELKEIWDDFTSNSLEGNEWAAKELEAFYEKRYKPYVADYYYKVFINAYALVPLLSAEMNGYKLQSKDEKTEDAYSFTVEVTYEKDGKDVGTVEVKGRINLDKDGKISRLLYLDDGGLLETLKKR